MFLFLRNTDDLVYFGLKWISDENAAGWLIYSKWFVHCLQFVHGMGRSLSLKV